MTQRTIPGAKPYFPPEDIPKILEDMKKVMQTGRLILGPYARQFEEDFARYVGRKYAIAVNSATTALQIVLQFYDIKDREVIVPTNTFLADGNAVIYAGGIPILSDVDPVTLDSGPEDIAAKITPRTNGVIVVHVGGHIHPRLNEIKHLCKEKGLFLIEDASHAHGSSYHGVKAGNLTDVACFSFYPTKVLTTGTGGIICTDDESLVKIAKSFRHHGQGDALTDLVRLGNNWVMNEFNAVVGVHCLKRLDEWVEKRNYVAKRYTEGLHGFGLAHPVLAPAGTVSAYYKYSVILDKSINRDALMKLLKEKYGIETGVIYWPTCHAQPAYKDLFGFTEKDFPKAEATLRHAIAFPMYVELTDDDIEYVLKSFKEAVHELKH